jgi:hypothetical protein
MDTATKSLMEMPRIKHIARLHHHIRLKNASGRTTLFTLAAATKVDPSYSLTNAIVTEASMNEQAATYRVELDP